MSVTVPKSESMPPELSDVFPVTAESTRVSVPSSTSIPPPKTLAEFPVTRESTRRAPDLSPVTAMPPPTQHPFPSTDSTFATPFMIFKPSIVVVPRVM